MSQNTFTCGNALTPVHPPMAAGSHITLDWPTFWGFYRKTTELIQSELLKQLDLPDMLKFSSIKTRQEVLAEAPQNIRDAIIGGNDEAAFHPKETKRDKMIAQIMGNWAH